MPTNAWGSYFDWLCDYINNEYSPNPALYYSTLWQLHTTAFTPSIELDNNRVQDALDFRSRFHDELPDVPVSMLELMVSLADRIEVETMGGTAEYDRTAEWFWEMFASLGLMDITNDNYDSTLVKSILDRFMDRDYSRYGEGGLFVVRDAAIDLRDCEIWYQAALYLNNVLRAEGVLES